MCWDALSPVLVCLVSAAALEEKKTVRGEEKEVSRESETGREQGAGIEVAVHEGYMSRACTVEVGFVLEQAPQVPKPTDLGSRRKKTKRAAGPSYTANW